jgi:hypothetical protein
MMMTVRKANVRAMTVDATGDGVDKEHRER